MKRNDWLDDIGDVGQAIIQVLVTFVATVVITLFARELYISCAMGVKAGWFIYGPLLAVSVYALLHIGRKIIR